MNAIQKALSDVKFRIPKEILEAAFIDDETNRSPVPITLDAMIREKVITPRVLVDMNLAGGKLHMVSLDTVMPEYADNYSAVFRIPKDLTDGRTISRVLALAYGDQRNYGNHIASVQNFNALGDAVNGVVASHVGVPVTETTSVSLIAENTVLLTDMVALPGRRHLRCYLDHDDELSQLRAPVIPFYSELVTLAVKAYIYNHLIMRIGRDRMVGGRDLGVFRQIVEAYADSEELYSTFIREKWRKINMFNDDLSRRRLTRLSSGGYY